MSTLRPSGPGRAPDLRARSRLSVGRRFALLALITLLATALYTAASASSSPTRPRGGGPDAAAPAPAPAAEATAPAPTSRAGYVPALLRQFAADTPIPATEVVETYAYDAASASCTSTPKDAFLLNETVCVKVSGGPSIALLGRRLSLTGPAGSLRDPANTDAGATSPLDGAVSTLRVTGDPQTFTIKLPPTATSMIDGTAVDNRGEWRVNSLLGTRFVIRTTATFTVSQTNTPSADLAVYNNLGADPAGVAAGATVDYVLWVVNRGPDAASNVTVSDSVPANASLVSATQTGGTPFACTNPDTNGDCPSGAWTVAQMARRSAATFKLTYQISGSASAGSVVTNTASVTSDTPDPSPANNTSDADITLSSGAAGGSCVLNCPGDVTRTADTTDANDAPGAIVTFGSAEAQGSCGTVTASRQSGTFFPVGTTQVTITSSEGASCSFNVTVLGSAAPTISCPLPVTKPAAAGDCSAALTAQELGAPAATGTGVTVEADRSDNRALDEPFRAGVTTITYTATDSVGRTAVCTQTVTVTSNDSTAPTITAPPDVVSPTGADGATCGKIIGEGLLGTPEAADNCSTVQVTRTGVPAGNFFPVGETIITYTATDGVNTATATQKVTVIETTPPVIYAPADASYSCPSEVPAADPSQAGGPLLDGVGVPVRDANGDLVPGGQPYDNCGVPLVTVTETVSGAGSASSPMVILRTYKATDAGGNIATAVQTITITDAVAPTIKAPDNIAAGNDAGSCSATLDPGTATAADDCGGATVGGARSDNLPLGAPYPKGVTTITWTATDAAGNTATAQQTVTVSDTEKPLLDVPADIVVGNDLGSCSALVNFSATATDNCGPATVTTSVPSGTTFPKGTTIVTATATDASGNATTRSFTVTVNDTEKPAVTVPANIVVTLAPPPSSATSMAVSYAATALDNCDGALTPVLSPASGSSFGVGTTTVTATAKDAAGNVTTRTFTVTVLYNFAGFFQPVSENPEVLNQVKAGQSVPMKFSLSGDKGLGVLATPPASVQVACPGNPTINDVSEVYTLAAGGGGLGYDALVDQYKYVWKTESSWVNTCRQFILRLNDGSEHKVNFKFK